jgi:hypothetical protein
LERFLFVVRFIRKLTLAAVVVCYAALAGLILYFPLGYLGEVVIYPLWRWSPLVERLAIKDSISYIFVLALLCAALQSIASSLANVGAKDAPE